jgi:hypothetical protein
MQTADMNRAWPRLQGCGGALSNWLGGTMDGSENRQIARDSLFVMADLRLHGTEDEHRIKVRNLSAGGMMGEGPVRVMRGAQVEINIRNIGWVEGSVAWVQDDRFGVAFREEIDPKVARAPVAAVPTHLPPPRHSYGGRAKTLRKI